MKKSLIGMAMLLLLGAATVVVTAAPTAAVTCYGRGEQLSGFNRICYYDCMGSLAAITIPSTSLCPLTIER